MSGLETNLSRCDLCGAPVQGEGASLGCLNCLLLGSPNDFDQETSFQHYELCLREDGVTLDELGHGAMGVTYRARDTNLGSEVALKVISTRYSDNPAARERFRREARAAAQLRHPNVASVFHFGETQAGRFFYAMELIEGETVEARICRDGPVSPILGLELATQVTLALTAAEAQGLVHRDLKPSNLMIVANHSNDPDALAIKVIDFGLAKAVAIPFEEVKQPQTSFSGTPDFASPEQLGRNQELLDTRSDIYSLGATLWYLLCGRTPCAGRSTGEVPDEALPFEQLALAHVPQPVVTLLGSMLALDPLNRPPSARELLADIQRCRQVIANPSFWLT
jgi:serine/threonine protein kinase